jgi:general secretion pathway protein B
MSSILKALKKLEHEKSVRKPYSYRIDTEILQGESSSRRSFSSSASLTAVALFMCGVGATYVYMKHAKTPATVQSSQESITDVKNEPSKGIPLMFVSNKAAAEPKPRPSVKVISDLEKSKPSPRSADKNQSLGVKPAEMVPQALTPEPKPISPPLSVTPVVAKPVLKVNGIAFQDGADSVAVINGITVSKGSVIEGARVEEIQKDHVKLSRDGEKFYIILEKSN